MAINNHGVLPRWHTPHISLKMKSSLILVRSAKTKLQKTVGKNNTLLFNLKIYYPRPYLREVWHYKEANADLIKRAISNFNWEKAFSDTNINEKVSLFNKTILNILNNYIPHETIICDDKDPPWFNSRIKSLIGNKDKIRKNYQRFKSNSQLLSKLNLLQEQLYLLLNKPKQNYYSKVASKLTNVQRNSKTFYKQ